MKRNMNVPFVHLFGALFRINTMRSIAIIAFAAVIAMTALSLAGCPTEGGGGGGGPGGQPQPSTYTGTADDGVTYTLKILDPPSNNPGNDNSSLNGTWVDAYGEKTVLNNGNITVSTPNNVDWIKGTYLASGGNLTITFTQFYGTIFEEVTGEYLGLSAQWYTQSQMRTAVTSFLRSYYLISQSEAEALFTENIAPLFSPFTGTYTATTLSVNIFGETGDYTKQGSGGGNTGGGAVDSSLVGTWLTDGNPYNEEVIFFSNGTVEVRQNGNLVGTGTISTSGNNYTLNIYDQTATGTFSVSGNSLSMYSYDSGETVYFTRSSSGTGRSVGRSAGGSGITSLFNFDSGNTGGNTGRIFRSAANPAAGDRYELTAGGKTSTGTVTSVYNGVFTLQPTNGSGPFTVKVSGKNITEMSGTITWDGNGGTTNTTTITFTPPSGGGNGGGGGSSDRIDYLEGFDGDGKKMLRTDYISYDSRGNPLKATTTTYGSDAMTSTIEYTYNSNGKIATMTTSADVMGMTTSTVIRYEYDSNGRETKMSASSSAMGMETSTYTNYTYLSNGNQRGESYVSIPMLGMEQYTGHTITEYNANGDHTKISHYDENGTLESYSVAEYSGRNPTKITLYSASGAFNGMEEFIYTGGRLTRANTYDENRKLQVYILTYYK